MHLPLSYVLPLRSDDDAGLGELAAYVRSLADHVEMIVVDGSESWLWHRVDAAFGTGVLHLRVDPTLAFLNGKVAVVTTGVHAASHEFVVIADDDVRYDLAALQRLCRLLEHADLVRPQNYFEPLPWHAVWDTARTLLNRAVTAERVAVGLLPTLVHRFQGNGKGLLAGVSTPILGAVTVVLLITKSVGGALLLYWQAAFLTHDEAERTVGLFRHLFHRHHIARHALRHRLRRRRGGRSHHQHSDRHRFRYHIR